MRYDTPTEFAWSQKTLYGGGVLVFLCIASGLLLHQSDWDRQWLLKGHQSAWLPDQVWLFITQWGDSGQALVLLLALWLTHPVKLAWLLKTWLMGIIASPLLKAAWDTSRPLSVLDPQSLRAIGHAPMGGHSMPSGHAMVAGSLAALLFWGWGSRWPGLRWVAVLLGAVIALSRTAVGAHWPGDVLVGFGAGVLLVLLAYKWEQAQAWSPRLSSGRAQMWLVVLMGVVTLALWRMPTEGLGMTLARSLVTTLAAISAVLAGLRVRTQPAGQGRGNDKKVGHVKS
jgi:hypothetical protein